MIDYIKLIVALGIVMGLFYWFSRWLESHDDHDEYKKG